MTPPKGLGFYKGKDAMQAKFSTTKQFLYRLLGAGGAIGMPL